MTYEDFIKEWHNNVDFIKAHTSGSTGKPKEIKLLKSFVTESACRTNDFFQINSNSKLHSCISPDYIGGKMMAVRACIAKANLSWEKPSNEALKNLDPGLTFDLVAVVPSQMIYILDNLSQLPKIKNLIIGGSPINAELKKEIIKSELKAYETYGMTETASHIALRRISFDNEFFSLLPGIKIGKNKNNCLTIYFKDGTIIDTNDIVNIISDNQFDILGRQDQMIISGGKKINPFEIENKISQFIDMPFCISAFPDLKWGERIILLIEGNSNKDEERLEDQIKGVLEKWQMPKDIFYVKKLPRTPNGKIIRPKDPSVLSSVSLCIDPSSLKQNT